MWLSVVSCHNGRDVISQCGGNIKSPWVHTLTNVFIWYDLRSYKDAHHQQPTCIKMSMAPYIATGCPSQYWQSSTITYPWLILPAKSLYEDVYHILYSHVVPHLSMISLISVIGWELVLRLWYLLHVCLHTHTTALLIPHNVFKCTSYFMPQYSTLINSPHPRISLTIGAVL